MAICLAIRVSFRCNTFIYTRQKNKPTIRVIESSVKTKSIPRPIPKKFARDVLKSGNHIKKTPKPSMLNVRYLSMRLVKIKAQRQRKENISVRKIENIIAKNTPKEAPE